MSIIQTAALLGSLAASVAAHGHVQGIVAGGVWYEGYNPSFQYSDPAPVVIGWSDPEDLGNGFIPPSNYSGPDIICHLGATPAGTSAKVAAGDVVELQWTAWPSSHHGPVLDYLAKCTGSCSDVEKTTLEFFKIDEVGLISDTDVPGTWATDQLIANNNSWAVTIPKTIAPGNYVLRHEIIALHSAEEADGAQNYPQCINIEITGSGTATPSGTLGKKLYSEDAPGILINIYESLSTYKIPGPTLYSGAVSMKQTEVAIVSAAAVETGSSTVWGATTTTASTFTAAATTSAAPTTSSTTAVPTSTSTKATSSKATSTKASSSKAAATTSSKKVSTSASATSHVAVVTSATSVVSVATVQQTTVVTASAASIASTSAAAPVASLVSALPSGALTKTIPTVLPTGGAHPTGGFSGNSSSLGDAPTKPLPAGYTLQDLLEWVAYMMKQVMSEGTHQRDFAQHQER